MEPGNTNRAQPTSELAAGRSVQEGLVVTLVRCVAGGLTGHTDEDIRGSSLAELGVASLGALTLQYQIEAQQGALIALERLLSAANIREIERLVAAERRAPVLEEVVL